MNSVTIFVGLDYHQDKVQVCVMDDEGEVLVNRYCINDWQAIVRNVSAVGQVHAAIEACCGAADLAEELATKAGWAVSLAHPGFTARMKQNPDKTDYTDAKLLADLVRVGYLPKVWLAPEEIRQLRRLVRFRQQLVADRKDVKLRIRALLRECRVQTPREFNPWTLKWLVWLQTTDELDAETSWIMQRQIERLKNLTRQITRVEKRLTAKLKNDAVVRKLMSFSGVGPITAATMRAEIGRFDRFASGKQLARFCGLSPRNASSGTRQADAGLIKAGNPQLRAVLIEAAHRLVRYEKRWRRMALEMSERGKPRCVITAAVANRWIRWLYYQMQPTNLAA